MFCASSMGPNARIPNIFEIPGALDAGEVAALIERTEQVGLELQTSRGPAYGEAVRRPDAERLREVGRLPCLRTRVPGTL